MNFLKLLVNIFIIPLKFIEKKKIFLFSWSSPRTWIHTLILSLPFVGCFTSLFFEPYILKFFDALVKILGSFDYGLSICLRIISTSQYFLPILFSRSISSMKHYSVIFLNQKELGHVRF